MTALHVEVFGSKICVLATGVLPRFTLASAPPVSITVESGRITALTYILMVSRSGPGVYEGFGCERSTIAVEAVANTALFCEPPPITSTFWSCAGGRRTLWPWSRRSGSVSPGTGWNAFVLMFQMPGCAVPAPNTLTPE